MKMPATAPTELELTAQPHGALAEMNDAQIVRSDPVLKLIEKVIAGGVTESNVAALDKLLDVYERLQGKEAERQFAAAFVKLQAALPVINASEAVPDKHGNIKYYFAPFEAIMAEIRPLLQANGFTVNFSMSFSEGRITQSCTLTHIDGHSRTNQFMVRIGSGPPGSSEAQADGAASTYAKRFALCNALNIVCDVDTDGKGDVRNEGEPLTPDKALYLKELAKEVGADEAAFLRYAGARTYAEIGSNRFEELKAALNKKRVIR